MASTIKLTWQWPAERKPDFSCRARITNICPDKKLPINSPSFVNYLPDPTVLEADIVDGVNYQSIQLKVPSKEIEKLNLGDLIELDLIDDNICTGIRTCG